MTRNDHCWTGGVERRRESPWFLFLADITESVLHRVARKAWQLNLLAAASWQLKSVAASCSVYERVFRNSVVVESENGCKEFGGVKPVMRIHTNRGMFLTKNCAPKYYESPLHTAAAASI